MAKPAATILYYHVFSDKMANKVYVAVSIVAAANVTIGALQVALIDEKISY